jgi:uncharacterized protein (TIGR03437 family)
VDPAASTQTVSIQATGADSLAEEHLSVQASGNPVLTVPGKQFATIGSKLSFQVGVVSGSGMVTLSTRSLPPGARFDSPTGVFEWTPDTPGKWSVEFSATDATRASARAEVAIETGDGSPVLENLRNPASGSSESVCSAGSLATARGGWLTQGTSESRVFVNGASVPVVYASPTEVSFACPSAQVGTTLAVAVETSIGRSATLTTVLRDSALGIFTVDGSGSGQAAASILDGARFAMPRNARYEGQPAQPGDVLQIAVTGLPSDTDPSLVTVHFGDLGVSASWVRPAAGSAGITQVGVTLPTATPVGDSVPLTIQQQLFDGRVVASQTVLIGTESLRQ